MLNIFANAPFVFSDCRFSIRQVQTCVKLLMALSQLNHNNTESCVKYVNKDYDYDDEVTKVCRHKDKIKTLFTEMCNRVAPFKREERKASDMSTKISMSR